MARLPPALLIHGAVEAEAALALAGNVPLTLLSAEGAAGFLGARTWLALLARAGATGPALLCCGDAPGLALGALRAGCRGLVLEGSHPAFPSVAAACAEAGVLLLPARPPALDLSTLNLRWAGAKAHLLSWLCAPTPHDSACPLR